MLELKDQVALITGAGSGIGRAIAVGLSARGVRLCLVGRNTEKMEETTKRAGIAANRVVTCRADLDRSEQITNIKETVGSAFGSVDILVHSAGIISMGAVESAPVEDLDRQYRTNVRAPYLLTQELLPMLRERSGQIVFINSSAGLHARPGWSQYAATKHALKAVADSLRAEVNCYGIRVINIFPGRTATPMQEKVHEMEGREYRPGIFMQPEDVADAVINALALPRSAEITDVNIRPMCKNA